jgi:hypothetical protein
MRTTALDLRIQPVGRHLAANDTLQNMYIAKRMSIHQ